jgi:hypothetical protein
MVKNRIQEKTLRNPNIVGELVAHFRKHELIDMGDEGKAYAPPYFCHLVTP